VILLPAIIIRWLRRSRILEATDFKTIPGGNSCDPMAYSMGHGLVPTGNKKSETRVTINTSFVSGTVWKRSGTSVRLNVSCYWGWKSRNKKICIWPPFVTDPLSINFTRGTYDDFIQNL